MTVRETDGEGRESGTLVDEVAEVVAGFARCRYTASSIRRQHGQLKLAQTILTLHVVTPRV